jgi:hypothetical protein
MRTCCACAALTFAGAVASHSKRIDRTKDFAGSTEVIPTFRPDLQINAERIRAPRAGRKKNSVGLLALDTNL